MSKITKGFTLTELLVSVGLFTAVATVIISVLFISLRTSKKSEVIISVKQNGNIALSRIANGIKFARSLDDPAICVPDAVGLEAITVTDNNGGQTVYSCPSASSTTISSNSAELINKSAVKVDACSFTCSQATVSEPPTITIQFTLSAATATNFAETTSAIPFKTSVTMRNYNR